MQTWEGGGWKMEYNSSGSDSIKEFHLTFNTEKAFFKLDTNRGADVCIK